MAGYLFRFETLLRLRRQAEDEKKRVVARRLREIQDLQRRQDLLRLRINEETQALRGELQEQRVDMDDLRLTRHWLSRLRLGVLEADAELAAHRAMLAQERSQLVGARRDAEAMARLKERQRDAFLAESSRREQAQLDELSVMRFSRAGWLHDEHEDA